MRRSFKWTKLQIDKLNKIKNILDELQEYKPLTLRQIYYQLVGKGYIENNISQYTMLSNLIKQARLTGYIEWNDIEDRGRIYHNLIGFTNKKEFIENEIKYFLTGYKRDLIQTQNKYIEVWIEKDALSSLFTKVCRNYTISVTVCRGYSSITFLNNFKDRLKYYQNKECLMLYFGDFDPSGLNMLEAMKETLLDELKVENLSLKRIALSREDIDKYKLPHSPTALKETDKRAKEFKNLNGAVAVELDALPPNILEEKIKKAIEDELDIDTFNSERKTEKKEIDKLNSLRAELIKYINNSL